MVGVSTTLGGSYARTRRQVHRRIRRADAGAASPCGGGRRATPGVPATGLKVLFDSAQGTALVLQYFDSVEDMAAGDEVFSAMDSSETPGTRASVNMCELRFEQTLG